MKHILLVALAGIFLTGCSQDELSNPLDARLEQRLQRLSPDGTIGHFILPESTDYQAIPAGKENPVTAEKVKLGQMLFFETGMALDAKKAEGLGTYSCSTCHIPSKGFTPGRIQGIADGGIGFGLDGEGRTGLANYDPAEMDVQGARPLSMLNVAYVTNSMWAGKFGANYVNKGTEYAWEKEEATLVNFSGLDGLEAQNIEGLKVHRLRVNREVMDSLGYLPLFDAAFSDFPEEQRYTFLTASFAISAYIRTLLTTEAPYQRWLKGEKEAMSEQEKRGAIVFFGKAGCYRCHKGPALNAVEFYALGVKDLYETGQAFNTSKDDPRNIGRGGFTGKEEDMFKFKVPQVYNTADFATYFHGSSQQSLREVVEYFNKGIPENPNVPESQIAPHFRPLYLTAEEVDDLVAFLATGLRDPNLQRYAPDYVLSGNCFPNNDPLSQKDLGCK